MGKLFCSVPLHGHLPVLRHSGVGSSPYHKRVDGIMTILYGALTGLVNGFLASGGGIVAVLVLERAMKIETKKAHATAIAIILPFSLASMLVYGFSGYIDRRLILMSALGGIAGAVVGAKLLGRLPKKYIKIGFGVIMIIAGGRMIFV